ncbi:MAG: Hsp20/alpha crystallin family protein [Nitrospinota bacterium]
MRLTLWDPFQGFAVGPESLHQLVREALRSTPGALGEGGLAGRWGPPVNIRETDDTLVLEADVPGFDPEGIYVEVHDGVLTLRGESRSEADEMEEGTRRVERYRGAFQRSFALPPSVDPDGIQARLRNGVLEVTVPKAPEAKRRPVSIETT